MVYLKKRSPTVREPRSLWRGLLWPCPCPSPPPAGGGLAPPVACCCSGVRIQEPAHSASKAAGGCFRRRRGRYLFSPCFVFLFLFVFNQQRYTNNFFRKRYTYNFIYSHTFLFFYINNFVAFAEILFAVPFFLEKLILHFFF